MEIIQKTVITVTTSIAAPVEKVWEYWTIPIHIMHWNNASDDWHTTYVENEVKVDGRFRYRMESRDGNYGFDLTGKYDKVAIFRQLEYTLDDTRKVHITFISDENKTIITEAFEAEQTNSPELQRDGWQAILNNFKKYVETSQIKGIIHFEADIKASPDKVYNILIGKKTYSEWTSPFNPSSHFEGNWQKGSVIHFLGEDSDGTTGGMASLIKENIPGRFVSIEHQHIIKDGKILTGDPENNEWSGSLENYTFSEKNGGTLFFVDVNSPEKYRSYFENTWPKALAKLKSICETR